MSEPPVLIGYATEYGSTRSIADRIGERLSWAGLNTEVEDLAAVKDPDRYRAFVLGSAVHGQAWLSGARHFVAANRTLLTERPLWLFSVGMPGALRGPLRLMAGQETPKVLAGLGPLHPRGHRLFSGVIAREQLPPPARAVFRLMGSRYGDFRNWPEIDSWADGIALALSPV